MTDLHDSGDRTNFPTGAMRDTAQGKPDFTPATTTYLDRLLLMTDEGADHELIQLDQWTVADELRDRLIDPDADFGYSINPAYGEYAPWMYLIPDIAVKRLSAHYGKGAVKYEPRNWEKGMPVSRYYASALRHMVQWANGDKREDHLSAVLFNICGIIFTEEKVASGELPADLGDLGWITSVISQP